MGQAQINVRTRACSRTSIARTKQAALTHNVRGKELTHFIPTTTVVVVTLSIPTTTVVVVAHCIPTTTFVVVDNDLSNLSAVNRPRARNPMRS